MVGKKMTRNSRKMANSLGCVFYFESEFNWSNKLYWVVGYGYQDIKVILHWQFLIKMVLLIRKLDWTHSLVEKCGWTKHWLPWATKVERNFQSWRDTEFDTKILPVSLINWIKISWQTIGRICSSGFFKCACWTQLWSNVVWAWSYSLQGMVFCYKNCSDLLWEKIVLVIKKTFEIRGWP